mmetsp:Transcript_13921/g.36094  ORF Transcript_13921/g.36094 Transcript_13921/m.36094 type:complete len:232 (+) Transcript_13921:232-927(+)
MSEKRVGPRTISPSAARRRECSSRNFTNAPRARLITSSPGRDAASSSSAPASGTAAILNARSSSVPRWKAYSLSLVFVTLKPASVSILASRNGSLSASGLIAIGGGGAPSAASISFWVASSILTSVGYVVMSTPPGRSTRYISASALGLSSGNMSPKTHVTIDMDSDESACMSCMSSCSQRMLSTLSVRTRALATMSASRSVHSTSTAGHALAILSAGSPGPDARSSTVAS